MFTIIKVCLPYVPSLLIISGENWKAEQDRKRIERERIIELPKRERKQTNLDLSKILDQKVNPPAKKPQPKKVPPKDQLKKALAEKIAKYKNPKSQLYISPGLLKEYTMHMSKFTAKDDRFLLLKLNEIGMDTINVYDKIKKAIQNSKQFKYGRNNDFIR